MLIVWGGKRGRKEKIAMGYSVSVYFTESLIHLEKIWLVLKFSFIPYVVHRKMGGANRFPLWTTHIMSFIKASRHHSFQGGHQWVWVISLRETTHGQEWYCLSSRPDFELLKSFWMDLTSLWLFHSSLCFPSKHLFSPVCLKATRKISQMVSRWMPRQIP